MHAKHTKAECMQKYKHSCCNIFTPLYSRLNGCKFYLDHHRHKVAKNLLGSNDKGVSAMMWKMLASCFNGLCGTSFALIGVKNSLTLPSDACAVVL